MNGYGGFCQKIGEYIIHIDREYRGGGLGVKGMAGGMGQGTQRPQGLQVVGE